MLRKRVDDRELPQHTPPPRGVVAQLVEHHNGIVGVISSILFGSTKIWLQQFCWSLFYCLRTEAGGVGGDKLSAVHVDGLLAHGNQVTIGANVHALICDGRGGVAAFIKVIDGEDFEFSVSAHHDGFAV